MIRFSILGTLDLRGPDGAEIRSALAQPKRLALLAYLAVATPHGFHRRDTLFALFWPELDNGGARNALSKALHHLRQSLGEGVLLNRGEGEVGIAPGSLWCDAVAFEETLDAGEWERAFELYRGELLPGFHIPNAPQFEHWLDEERARLRRQAAEATWKLAEQTEQTGDPMAAIRWAERAVAFSPGDECALRRFIALLDRQGDRAAALRAYDAFAQWLAREFEVEPSSETQALVAALRGRRDNRVRAVSFPDEPVPVRPAEARVEQPNPALPPVAPMATPALRSRRWLILAAITAAVLLGGLGTGLLLQPRPHPGVVENRLLVAAFENRTGDPGLDLLGEMAADWITQGLQQTGLAQVVDPISAMLAARTVTTDSAHLTGLARASAMARGAGAGAVIWGAVYQQSDSLHFRALITDLREGRLLLALDPVSASVHDPMGGAERLREQVAGALASLLDRRIASISATSSRPPTLAAYREYVLGLEQFQRNRGMDALPHFAAAARLDTTFALPLIWSVFAYGNAGYVEQEDSIVQILAARRERLSPIDRHALDYFLAHRRRDVVGALEATRAAARLSPGSNWSHNAGMRALAQNRPREALRYLRDVDPEHGWARGWFPYWMALTSAHHLLGEHEAELETTRRARRLDAENVYLRYLAIRALIAVGDMEEAEAEQEELLLLPPAMGSSGGEFLLAISEELWVHGYGDRAREAQVRAIDWFRSPATEGWVRTQADPLRARLRSSIGQAKALYAAGQWEESRVLFESIAAQDSTHVDTRTYLGLLAARRGDRQEAERTIRFLEKTSNVRNPPQQLRQARIAALLEQRERAMGYLSELVRSNDDDRAFLYLHREPDWDVLRDYPPFQELIRPKE